MPGEGNPPIFERAPWRLSSVAARVEAAPLRAAATATALGFIMAGALGPVLLPRTGYFFPQDALWLELAGVALLIGGWMPAAGPALAWTEAILRSPRRVPWLAALFMLIVGLAGSALVFRGFALSYDEVMAEFDAAILRTGRLVALAPPEWRPFASALVPTFRLPVPGDAAWVSAYLPVNAALRALVSVVLEPAWTGPLLAAVAVFAVYRIARRLWPQRPDAAAVAVVLLASSPQVLVTAMTPYAMTAHLALNLVWLSLFLRNDRAGHAGALAVGFLACGLHQVIFHPLFVAPFILHLLAGRRWRLASVYVAGYGAICGFWVVYWQLALAWSGLSEAGGQAGAGLFLARVIEILRLPGAEALDLMAKNLLRFAAWQNPAMLALAPLAAVALRAREGVARPLLDGILLTAAAAFLLLPYQGHGWGYRYLHGLIGSFCLLAAQGWIRVTSEPRCARAPAMLLGCSATFAVAVLLPARLEQALRFLTPYREAVTAIEHASAQVVVVDPSGLYFGDNLVRNDPFLRNRPIVLSLAALDGDRLRSICGRFRVALFEHRDGLAYGIRTESGMDALAERRSLMHALACGEPLAMPR
jgi:hypothetical protein